MTNKTISVLIIFKKMKALLVICLFCFSAAHAQDVHLTAFGGFANYQGDLQDKRFTTQQSHGAFGGGVLYQIADYVYLRANVTSATVSADDKYSVNKIRNLNFTSKIIDYHFGVEFDLFDPYERGFTPYVFAGLSLFHFNPYTTDSGKKYFLQPLGTEGQGFYENRKKYSLTQLSIPFGGGFKFALGENILIGAEIGLRKTNTDYLDDVSESYADKDELKAFSGQAAVSLAFRENELKAGTPYPGTGSLRGSPKNKDWYYFTGLTISYRLHSSDNSGGGKRYRLRCPRA